MITTSLIGLVFATLVWPTVLEAKNVVCYYGSWATYRSGAGQFTVGKIDPFLCTHAVYSFAGINTDGTLKVLDPWLDLEEDWGLGAMRRFTNLTNVNPNLKTLLAIGGWNEGSQKFSVVASSATLREKFAKSAADFCQSQGFDGIDVDWEYPAQRDGHPFIDRDNFVYFLQALKKELSGRGMLLTAAVAAAEFSASISYNIAEISKYLDFINLMTYDFHGSWDRPLVTGHNAPLNGSPNDVTAAQKQLNVRSSVIYWLQQGAPASKINLGMPLYGQSFTLRALGSNGVGAAASGPGQAGPYTQTQGFLGYNEICEKLTFAQWNQVWDPVQQAAYAYSDNQWVGYDSAKSISLKCDLINQLGLAGGMVWSMETDDFTGKCGVKFPLLRTMNNKLGQSGGSTTTATTSTAAATTTIPATTSTVSAPVTTTVAVTTSTTTKVPTTVTAPSETFKCSSDVGFFRDPVDCAKFYYCDGVRQYDFECPIGLFYDLNMYVCNWSYNVEC